MGFPERTRFTSNPTQDFLTTIYPNILSIKISTYACLWHENQKLPQNSQGSLKININAAGTTIAKLRTIHTSLDPFHPCWKRFPSTTAAPIGTKALYTLIAE